MADLTRNPADNKYTYNNKIYTIIASNLKIRYINILKDIKTLNDYI